jgi:hypothetical protein
MTLTMMTNRWTTDMGRYATVWQVALFLNIS